MNGGVVFTLIRMADNRVAKLADEYTAENQREHIDAVLRSLRTNVRPVDELFALAGKEPPVEGEFKEIEKSMDVQVAAICDIDENAIHGALSTVEKKAGNKPVYYQDFRKLMEDKSIDAVSVATCNHTHTLIAINAVIAGKHVYVEKPLSHNVWEGRKLVEAARKYNKVVQHGTQSRSGAGFRKTDRRIDVIAPEAAAVADAHFAHAAPPCSPASA
jgi:predicted dehydrogenase